MGQPQNVGSWRSDGFRVALLLIFAASLHVWVFTHTGMASRDSIGYIRYALQLEQHSWLEALPHLEQHPLYPASLLAISFPVRQFLGMTPQAMVISAQLAGTIAGVLLVIPVYFLGREIFDRRVGFWTAVLFQSLPVAAHVMCDALSESLFLLFSTTALLFAAQGCRLRSPLRFALCGISSGLAYLTRPEGVLMAGAALLVLLAIQLLPARRWAWPKAVACGTALAVALAVVAGPYMVVIGGLTVKPTGRKMLGTLERDDTLPPPAETRVSAGPVLAMTWGVWLQGSEGNGRPTVLWAFEALVRETLRTFQWVFWLPALLGLWVYRAHWRATPGSWVVFVAAVGLWLGLWRMAVVVGYVSERHLLFPVLCFGYPTVACLCWCVDRLPDWAARASLPWPTGRWQVVAGTACLAFLTAWNLPWAAKSLHANRLGHKEAGLWIAAHAQPSDPVVDPFCWAHFYAGRVFLENQPLPANPATTEYVVLETSSNPHSRLPVLPVARQKAAHGRLVYEWLPSKKQHERDKAEPVAVFAVPMEFSNPGTAVPGLVGKGLGAD